MHMHTSRFLCHAASRVARVGEGTSVGGAEWIAANGETMVVCATRRIGNNGVNRCAMRPTFAGRQTIASPTGMPASFTPWH